MHTVSQDAFFIFYHLRDFKIKSFESLLGTDSWSETGSIWGGGGGGGGDKGLRADVDSRTQSRFVGIALGVLTGPHVAILQIYQHHCNSHKM